MEHQYYLIGFFEGVDFLFSKLLADSFFTLSVVTTCTLLELVCFCGNVGTAMDTTILPSLGSLWNEKKKKCFINKCMSLY